MKVTMRVFSVIACGLLAGASVRADEGPVAHIGGVAFADLQSALDAARDGQTVTLAQDVISNDLTEATWFTLPAGKSVTLDLNGHTIYGEHSISNASSTLLKVCGDLTIDDTSAAQTGRLAVKPLKPAAYEELKDGGYCSDLVHVSGGTCTVAGGLLENLGEGDACHALETDANAPGAIAVQGGTVRAQRTVVRLYAHTSANALAFTMSGGTVESVKGRGIQYYAPSGSPAGKATLCIAGGTIRAVKYAIYIYGPTGGVTLDVTGGDISSSSEEDTCAVCLYCNRAVSLGRGLTRTTLAGGRITAPWLLGVWDYYGASQTTFSGGTYAGELYAYAYDNHYLDYCRRDEFAVKVTGGTFTDFSVRDSSDAWFLPADLSAILLYGGTYDRQISTGFDTGGRVATGYGYRDNLDGTWTVVRLKAAAVAGVEYPTLAEAYENAGEDETIKLLSNITLEEPFVCEKNLKLDLNGCFLYGLYGEGIEAHGATLKVVGAGTVLGEIATNETGRIILYGGSYYTDITNGNYVADICEVDGLYPNTVTAKAGGATGVEVTVKDEEGEEEVVEGQITITNESLAEQGTTVEELNNDGQNGLKVWQSVVLGLDANDASSLPLAKHEQQLDQESIKVKVMEVQETSAVPEATIVYMLYGSNDKNAPDEDWVRLKDSDTPEIVIERGADGYYRYYRIRTEISVEKSAES